MPSKDVSTHVIIFKDKSKKFINQKAFDIFWREAEKGKTEVLINKTIISIPSIAKLISVSDYYNQYPDERNSYIPLFEVKEKKQYNRNALRGMTEGLRKYIASACYQGTNNPKELLALMENKLKNKIS